MASHDFDEIDEDLSFRDIQETKASVNFETEQNQIEIDDIKTKQLASEEKGTLKARRGSTIQPPM